jgi:hypothetical protein
VDEGEQFLGRRDVPDEMDGDRRATRAVGHGQDADVEPDAATRLGPRAHVEVLDGLAHLDESDDLAAGVAEAVAIVV